MFPCSHRLHWGHGLLLVLALATLYNVDLTRPAVRARLAYVSFWQSSAAADFKTYESTLGVAADIYVANLPRREDRRHNMTVLAEALGARFTFVDAVDSDSEEIQNILDHVRLYRTHSEPTEFAWPASDAPIMPLDWTGPLPEGTVLDDSVPLTCNEFDDSPRPYSPTMKDAFILSKKKIACYESHLRLLRRIAASPGSRSWSTGRESHVRAADVAIILEDDIDVEQDFRERLQGLWTTLPKTWDMVFFGWCWSNEMANWPVAEFTPEGSDHRTSLRLSHAPLCAHAYAVSVSGARKLLSHLDQPAFAYSRQMDQAYAWLIESGRIDAYSLTPAIAIQRKISASDIWTPGREPKWEESLYQPVLANLDRAQ